MTLINKLLTDLPSVYVASGLPNWRRIRAINDRLRQLGVRISYDWTVWGEALQSDVLTKDDEELFKIAMDEARGVMSADAVLVVMPGGRGTHFEMGVAWASGTPLVMLTEPSDTDRPLSFHRLKEIERTDDDSEALARVVEISKAVHMAEAFEKPNQRF